MKEIQGLISDYMLIDMDFKGPKFSWSNSRPGVANVQKRIDRVLVNAKWYAKFQKIQVLHEAKMASDHSPLIINMEPEVRKSPYYFIFETLWMENTGCEDRL